MNKHLIIGLVISTALVFSSCKYDEGPTISLRPKNERVENTWKVEEVRDGDEDRTDEFEQYELRLTADGNAELRAEYFGVQFETTGIWKFENSKEDIYMNYEDDDADQNYEIIKLKEKEMWLKETDGDRLEFHLIPA